MGNRDKHEKLHSEDSIEEKSILCHDCGAQFSQKSALDYHIRKKVCLNRTMEGIFICPSCKKEYPSMAKLKLHLVMSSFCSYDNEKKPYPCEYCERSFMTEKKLEVHTRTHTGEKPFQCEKCSKSFKFLHRLNYHNCIYAQLFGFKALERFYQFDTNKDGFITPGEVLARNITIEGFNLVDLDKDGLIVPAEIDESLVIF